MSVERKKTHPHTLSLSADDGRQPHPHALI
jgi:hypothetical protein